jgi:acetyl-CoA synthetase
LRLLGTVGEGINPEAWMWYHRKIGGERCPIVDTWWQTETGGIMITPLPGVTPTKPGSATKPFPGVIADVMTRDGKSVGANQGGFLVIKRPWPGMMRTIYGDGSVSATVLEPHRRCLFHRRWRAREDGYYWVMGRVDDVLNVSGHRLGTMEVESALVAFAGVAEAAVVGRPDALKGQAITAFVTLETGRKGTDALKEELRQQVAKEIGAFAKPDDIRFTDALPKTRSGKIMRRLLRDIAAGSETIGDTTTLEDLSVLAKLREDEE